MDRKQNGSSKAVTENQMLKHAIDFACSFFFTLSFVVPLRKRVVTTEETCCNH